MINQKRSGSEMKEPRVNNKVYLNMAQVARVVGRAPWEIQRAVNRGELKNHAVPKKGAVRVEAQILLEDAQKWAETSRVAAEEPKAQLVRGEGQTLLLAKIESHLRTQNYLLQRLLDVWEPHR
jgi:hypothetical protein